MEIESPVLEKFAKVFELIVIILTQYIERILNEIENTLNRHLQGERPCLKNVFYLKCYIP